MATRLSEGVGPGGAGGGSAPSHHALGFRVMRLCRPALSVEPTLRVHRDDLTPDPPVPDPTVGRGGIAHTLSTDVPFAHRTRLDHPADALGMAGMLVLPQSFGTIYLGETFSSFISVGNFSDHAVSAVGIKAELQTERKRVVLYDNTANLLPVLTSNGRHDFIVEHDLKEIGPHTLVCSTVYTDMDEERKYLPQYFKFTVANPLAVRTKVRHLADSTLLEACIENCTRNPLFLSSVNFDSSPAYVVTPVDVEPTPPVAASDASSPLAPPPPDATSSKESAAATILGTALRGATIVRANSGSRYYLFRLTKAEAQGAGAGAGAVGGGTLGKLEIQWRLNMGEPGRLQTQQILGGLTVSKAEVVVSLLGLPARVVMEAPFPLRCLVSNHTAERRVDLQLAYLPESATSGVVADGLHPFPTFQLAAGEQRELDIMVVAVAHGVQRIAGVSVLQAAGAGGSAITLDTMRLVEVFVDVE